MPGPNKDMAPNESIDDLMQHLPDAKERNKSRKRKRKRMKKYTNEIARTMARDENTGVLTNTYESRREEMVTQGIVTHRSNKGWKSALVAYKEHGRVPIYYRTGSTVTHAAYITDIAIDLEPESARAARFRAHISDEDTWSDTHDEIAPTIYIVENAVELTDPFPMTDLKKVKDSEPIDENFIRPLSYVYLRDGDFPLNTDE